MPVDHDLLYAFRARLTNGMTPELKTSIEHAVESRRGSSSGHTDWGLLCEEAGLLGLALREFQLALRDDPHDAQAAFRLAHHYREHGDLGRAAQLLEPLLEREPGRDEYLALYAEVLQAEDAGPRLRAALARAVQCGLAPERAEALGRQGLPEDTVETAEQDFVPNSADCMRFQSLFAGREDVHARQWAAAGGAGGYSPVHEPLTPAVVRNHLLGTYTVGVYPLRLDGTCTFFAVDLDIDKGALEQAHARPVLARELRDKLRAEATRLLRVLRDLGFTPLFEDSGYKGRHFWGFLAQPEPAAVLHQLGRQFLAWQTPQVARGLHLEFFPKQAERSGKGLGNLIKLPLGIHRRTGRRALLLDDSGQPLTDPLATLRAVARLSRPILYAAIERLKGLDLRLPAGAARPDSRADVSSPAPSAEAGPPPPARAPAWTEADFETDPHIHHLLASCPVLAELKRSVDEHRSLSHEEQLVLIHSLGHLKGGPQAVNYLLGRCVDVGPEKFMKDRLKGNPVSCPTIRKKIGHVTRRVACNCSFDGAPDRYPTPVLHVLTLPPPPAPLPRDAPAADLETLARRYAVLKERRAALEREEGELRQALVSSLRTAPDRAVACPGGRFRLSEREGVEELVWEATPTAENPAPATE